MYMQAPRVLGIWVIALDSIINKEMGSFLPRVRCVPENSEFSCASIRHVLGKCYGVFGF